MRKIARPCARPPGRFSNAPEMATTLPPLPGNSPKTRRPGATAGFFYPDEMVPEFEEASFALRPGEISELVETDFGVHIIRLEERREPHLLPLEEIRDELREHIRVEKSEYAVEVEIDQLRAEADVSVLIPLASRNDKGGR